MANFKVNINELLVNDEYVKGELSISGNSSVEYLYDTNKRFFIVNASKTKITEFDNDKIAGMQYTIVRYPMLAIILLLAGMALTSVGISEFNSSSESIIIAMGGIFFLFMGILLFLYRSETLMIYVAGTTPVKITIATYAMKIKESNLKSLIKKLRENSNKNTELNSI